MRDAARRRSLYGGAEKAMQTALRSKVLALLALLVLYEYKSTNAGAEKAMQTVRHSLYLHQ